MKKIKVFLKATCAGAAIFVLCATMVRADGVVMPMPGKMIYETDQKAILFYDEGVEHLFLSITFQGDADNFAWIVPTPAQPEVGKSSDRVFTRLDELTRPEYPAYRRQNYGPMMGAMEGDYSKQVTVLETKRIEYYDIAVLEANNNDALYNWLNDHGYTFPQAGKNIIDEYIQKGWVFTAVKIDDHNFSNVGQRQLQTGHAIPLRLSFQTDQLVYPLKISSINGMKDDAPEGKITYIDGAVGKAVKLDTDRMMSTDAVISDFDITNGKISLFLKKRDSQPLNSVLKVEKASADGSIREGLRIDNSIKNTYNLSLYARGVNQTFSVDLGSDFKENEWQKFEFDWTVSSSDQKKFQPSFSIDGAERTLKTVTSYSNSAIVDRVTEKASLSIGGEFYLAPLHSSVMMDQNGAEYSSIAQPDDFFVNHNNDILVDEIQLFSGEQQILDATFGKSLKVKLADESEDDLRIFTKRTYDDYGWQKPTGMGVLLYIFADKRYEIPEFDLQFAGPIDKEGIENIAKIDGKTPWIEPSQNDYYLTRLYKYMDISEMSEDIYPEESDDQSVFNYAGGEKTRIWLVVGLIGLSTISILAMVWLVLKNEKQKKEGTEESLTDKLKK